MPEADIERILAVVFARPLRGTEGGLYAGEFLRAVRPLYDLHMGVENMGPLLYHSTVLSEPCRLGLLAG
eukprot:COSAG01_NODE_2588_length_7414_cov_4.548052_6_plen_69_part_00